MSLPEGAVGAARGRKDMATQSMILNTEAISGGAGLQSQLRERLRWEDGKSEASLGYIRSSKPAYFV